MTYLGHAKMKKVWFLCAIAFCFCSCSPKVHKHIVKTMPSLGEETEITVYNPSEVVPENAEIIGEVSVLDGGFTTRCDWETVLETAKQEARLAGGNGLEILQHSYPGQNGSGCHQIVGFILNISDDIEPIELSDFAQQNFKDYVVVKEGDTVSCSIVDENKASLGFIYERNGVRRFANMPKNSVVAYHIADPIALAEAKAEREKKDFNVRIGLQGGYGFRTAKLPNNISPDYKDYLRKLTRGPVLGANVRFNISSGITLGLYYDRFFKGVQAEGYFYDEDGNYYEGNISNFHTINFIAGSFGMMGLTHNKKHSLYYDLLFGYMDYQDKAKEFDTKYTLSGKTFGLGMVFGYDYLLTKHLAIGVEASYHIAALSKVRYEDGIHIEDYDLGNSREGLQRANLKAGISYYF